MSQQVKQAQWFVFLSRRCCRSRTAAPGCRFGSGRGLMRCQSPRMQQQQLRRSGGKTRPAAPKARRPIAQLGTLGERPGHGAGAATAAAERQMTRRPGRMAPPSPWLLSPPQLQNLQSTAQRRTSRRRRLHSFCLPSCPLLLRSRPWPACRLMAMRGRHSRRRQQRSQVPRSICQLRGWRSRGWVQRRRLIQATVAERDRLRQQTSRARCRT